MERGPNPLTHLGGSVVKKFFLSITATCCFIAPSLTHAAGATTFSEFLAIDGEGNSAYSGEAPVVLTGVVINNPYDMLDGTTQWQVFIQSLNLSDYGGAALYMGKIRPWNGTTIYEEGPWADELERLMYSGTDGLALGYGDVITVTANAPGQFYNGKYNINEKHSSATANDFTITVLQRGTMPKAADITLAALKDDNDDFIFDSTRGSGCEQYQGTLVHLGGLTLENASEWTAAIASNYDEEDGLLSATVLQTIGDKNYSFEMVLGLDDALADVDASLLTTTPFSVTAILDQESSNYKSGYRLWLTDADLLTIPEPGTLAMLAAGLVSLLAYVWRRRK